MKIGIVICTHNRLVYLEKCLESIEKSFIPLNSTLFFVDDGSEDYRVIDLINSFCSVRKSTFSHFKKRMGIHHSLLLGFDALIMDGCDILINIDSDAIVSKNWITVLLKLHFENEDTIVSGFNTLSCDIYTKQPRHPVVKEFNDYILKRSIGGINMCFNKIVYDKYVRKSLVNNWDWNLCHSFKMENKYFVVSKPSVVQHIGTEGMHKSNPDISHDFIYEND